MRSPPKAMLVCLANNPCSAVGRAGQADQGTPVVVLPELDTLVRSHRSVDTLEITATALLRAGIAASWPVRFSSGPRSLLPARSAQSRLPSRRPGPAQVRPPGSAAHRQHRRRSHTWPAEGAHRYLGSIATRPRPHPAPDGVRRAQALTVSGLPQTPKDSPATTSAPPAAMNMAERSPQTSEAQPAITGATNPPASSPIPSTSPRAVASAPRGTVSAGMVAYEQGEAAQAGVA